MNSWEGDGDSIWWLATSMIGLTNSNFIEIKVNFRKLKWRNEEKKIQTWPYYASVVMDSQSPTKQLLNKSGSTWGVRSIKIFSQVLTALLPADPWGCYQLGQTLTLVWECWANIEGLSWRGIPPPGPALPKLLSNVWTSVEFLIQLKISLFQWTKDDSGVVFPVTGDRVPRLP